MGTFATSPASSGDEIAALKALIAGKDAHIAILEEKLRLATHQQFAPKSEKLASLGQIDLFFNEAEHLAGASDAHAASAQGAKPDSETQANETVVPEHKRARGKRRPIDASLPRVRVVPRTPSA